MWYADYKEILFKALPEWKAAAKQGRSEVIRNTTIKIFDAYRQNPDFKELLAFTPQAVVRNWFRNNRNHPRLGGRRASRGGNDGGDDEDGDDNDDDDDDDDPPKESFDPCDVWRKRWTGRRVAQFLHSKAFKAVYKACNEIAFSQRYNEAIRKFWKKIGEKKQATYTETAKDWNTRGPPQSHQPAMARKQLSGVMDRFAKYAKENFGATVMIFATHMGENGVPINRWVETKGGKTKPSEAIGKPAFDSLTDWWVARVGPAIHGKTVMEKAPKEDLSWTNLKTEPDGYPILAQIPFEASAYAVQTALRNFFNILTGRFPISLFAFNQRY
ncbi:hypothetical protein ONZ45_g10881 [Pleurotus djamor]|nr:hypothetical protein ONZ45_g10881 [Pleurotus djamor]